MWTPHDYVAIVLSGGVVATIVIGSIRTLLRKVDDPDGHQSQMWSHILATLIGAVAGYLGGDSG